MNSAKYYLETFGCQMNMLDSQLVDGQLRRLGLVKVQDEGDADVILFNTCSVRQHAEDRVLSRIGQLKRRKARRPELIIGVLGCMAEREKEGLFVKAPQVDLLCGPGELGRLPSLLAEVQERHARVAALAGSLSRRTEVLRRAPEYDSLEALDSSRAPGPNESVLQSYVRVQRGCDQFCTYCIVPFTRGPERSRPPAHIIEEIRGLAEQGCREVTLLGQTVNSYVYQENGQPVPFARLLERVHGVVGIERIRFVTSFPADWDEDIFRVMRDCPRIMPYLHIPAQSGADRILKAMRRGYTVAEYLRLMDLARQYLPDIAVAGDFIVGFCGETEEDFKASVDLVRRVEYQNIFVFKYSPRPGTAANRSRADDVPPDLKAQRNTELLAVQGEIALRQKEALVGQTVEVLVQGYSKAAQRASRQHAGEEPGRGRAFGGLDGDGELARESEQDRGAEVQRGKWGVSGRPITGQLTGRTPGDAIVVFDGTGEEIGALAKVRITAASALTLFGELVEVASPARGRVHGAREGAAGSGAGRSLPVIGA